MNLEKLADKVKVVRATVYIAACTATLLFPEVATAKGMKRTSDNIYTDKIHAIRTLQATASFRGIDVGDIDGKFGPKTKRAVEELFRLVEEEYRDPKSMLPVDVNALSVRSIQLDQASDEDVADCIFFIKFLRDATVKGDVRRFGPRSNFAPATDYVTFPDNAWSNEWAKLNAGGLARHAVNLEVAIDLKLDGEKVPVRLGSLKDLPRLRSGGVLWNTHKPTLEIMSGTECMVPLTATSLTFIGGHWYVTGK